MDLHLENSVAFVAGASSGLGRSAARQLLLEGCAVAVCSRKRERIESAAEELRTETGGRVLPLVCDVTDEEAIVAGVAETVKTFGSLNILITNAGGPPPGGIDAFDSAAWRGAIELNLMSTINLTRHALPHIRNAAASPDGFGRILMITSLTVKQPVEGLLLSNASRPGIHGFAKSLSAELGPEGITVNTIVPGYTKTDRLRGLAEARRAKTGESDEEIEADWAGNIALKRIGREEEFGVAAAFLVSRPASYITGVSLGVDGGVVKSLL